MKDFLSDREEESGRVEDCYSVQELHEEQLLGLHREVR